ncbi:ribosomal protein L30p/L7e [Batrachochytrium dendrobatidis JEL423]|uniref:Large ribosomal subunit protein uL30m n=1 Tax=Batrachochytrium dendrobatidis (strain JEL423) TaxID=403673 RepID=A0A177WSZ3_BATDL|nr:ribosomal protein L30p/L7e [Batrachochytrium dendrobatidis JEL423]
MIFTAGTKIWRQSTSTVNWFSTTSVPHYPRAPRKQSPNVTPRFPLKEQLSTPVPIKAVFPKPQAYKYGPGMKPTPFPPNTPKRHHTDVESGIPLPTTFAPGETAKSIRTRPTRPERKLTQEEYPFPYRYFEITLRRGVIGLPKTTRDIVKCLGLHTRYQVVWRLVGPRSAGQILKVKELVNMVIQPRCLIGSSI